MDVTQAQAEDAAVLAMLGASLRAALAGRAADDDGRAVLLALGVMPERDLAAIGGLSAALLVAQELGSAGLGAPWPAALAASRLGMDAAPHLLGPGERLVDRDGRLGGTTALMPACDAASAVLLARGEGWVELDLPAPGVQVLPAVVLNATGLMARVRCDGASARPVTADAEAAREALALARLASVARACGAAQAGFDLALDHARTRQQFGQPIGRFQAIQHKLANGCIALAGVAAHLRSVAQAHDAAAPDWVVRAEAALAFAGPALRQVALDNHHVLGAIGYAEEHAAPGLFRRVHVDTVMLGGAERARHALAEAVVDAGWMPGGAGAAGGFRAELRGWLAAHWGEAARGANRARPHAEQNWDPAFARAMGEAGLTMLTWPRAAGGRGADAMEQLAFLEEMHAAAAPIQHTTVASWIVGPELLAHGNPQLCADLLDPIRRGEVSFCLGYSEPGAGSDLAALATRARRDGDGYRITGHKLWNTDGHRASHMILAARTDADARPRHAGISLFLVPMDTPGITVRPGMAMYGHLFSEIFLDDVRVPEWRRLGPENGGWRILTNALASERVIMASFGSQLATVLRAMVRAVREAGLAGDGAVRARLADLAARVETARLLALAAIAPGGEAATAPLVAAAIGKVFASELGEALAEAGLDLLGPAAMATQGDAAALADGAIDEMLRRAIMMVIGGGTAEIQRNLIALRGLELPK